MDIKDPEIFLAVVQEKSIARASKRLYMTLPGYQQDRAEPGGGDGLPAVYEGKHRDGADRARGAFPGIRKKDTQAAYQRLAGKDQERGMVFGRTEPLGPKDPDVNKCMSYSKKLHAACCRILAREFDMGKGGRKKLLCVWRIWEASCRRLRR